MKRGYAIPLLMLFIWFPASGHAQFVGGSPFYEFEVIAQVGDSVFGATDGPLYISEQGIHPFVSVNDRGQVALIPHMYQVVTRTVLDQTVVVTNSVAPVVTQQPGTTQLRWLGALLEQDHSTVFNQALPQINNAGRVIVAEVSSTVICDDGPGTSTCTNFYSGIALHTYDASQYGFFLNVDDITDTADPATWGRVWSAFPHLTHLPEERIHYPTLANDGAFAALTWNGPLPIPTIRPKTTNALYRGNVGQSATTRMTNDTGRWNAPMMGAGTNIIMRTGSATNGTIRWYRGSGSPTVLMSTTQSVFSAVHQSPGISRDGRVAVMMASDSNKVEGIYIHVRNDSGTVLPTTLVINTNTPIAYTTNGVPITLGQLGVTLDAPAQPGGSNPSNYVRRINVTRHPSGDPTFNGDVIIIAFLAKPSAASAPNPFTGSPLLFSSQMGLWTLRVDLKRDLAGTNTALRAVPRGPLPVIQVGDTVGATFVQSIRIWDSIGTGMTYPDGSPRSTLDAKPRPGDHVLAFTVNTGDGPKVIRALHFDTDGDGLPDHWERPDGGIDITRDGWNDIVLANWGASPYRYDLFLEADFAAPRQSGTPRRWQSRPPAEVFHRLAEMFANAPIQNPDGSSGITLHVDAGPAVDPISLLPYSVNVGPDPGFLQGGNEFTMPWSSERVDIVQFGAPPAVTAANVRVRSFHDIKQQHFGNDDFRARELAFRYAVFAEFGGLAHPHATGRVASANAFSFTPTQALSVTGGVVMITWGTGTGQFRYLDRTAPMGPSYRITERWNTIPDDTSHFAILSTRAGASEVTFRPSPGNHALPGNDLLITLGGWGVDAYGRFANPEIQWQMLAHEIGHTLGLRHGGTDHCAYKGTNYLSLMSYSHLGRTTTNQPVRRTCPGPTVLITNVPLVRSFSGASDPTFNDWTNILPQTYANLAFVGNTFGLPGGLSTNQAGPTFEEAELDLGPLDLQPPFIDYIHPTNRTRIAMGGTLQVQARIIDESAIESVIMSFDIDGDGELDGPGEVVEAVYEGNDIYSASFSGLSGVSTTRTLHVTATDTHGNIAYSRVLIGVGNDAVFSGSAWPSANDAVWNRVHLIGADISLPVWSSNTSEVHIGMDVNGDGVIEGPLEWLSTRSNTGNEFAVTFRNISGPPGPRSVIIHAYHADRSRATLNRTIHVGPYTEEPPVFVDIDPPPGTDVPLGSSFVMTVTVDSPFTNQITVTCTGPLSGSSPSTVTLSSIGSNQYRATLPSAWTVLGGSEGPRTLTVRLTDPLQNVATETTWINAVDLLPPVVTFQQPQAESMFSLGAIITNIVNVTDDQAVAGVRVQFDVDGDGVTTGPGEDVIPASIGGNNYRAIFPALSGPEGPRTITFTAWDPSGKTTTVSRTIHVVNGGVIRGLTAGDTLLPGRTVTLYFDVAQGITPQTVTFLFDRDGDGQFDSHSEIVVGQTNRVTQQFFADFSGLSGTPGIRTARVEMVDAAFNVYTAEVTVVVGEFDGFAGPVSEKLGAVPLLPAVQANGNPIHSSIESLTCVDGMLFFLANDGISGKTLWRTDGTRQGTQSLRNFYPFFDFNIFTGDRVPLGAPIGDVIAFDGRLFLAAADSPQGAYSFGNSPDAPFGQGDELWISDGTPAGTRLFKDIHTATNEWHGESSSPREFVVLGDHLYFVAQDTNQIDLGRNLWRSDGTPEGTERFLDTPMPAGPYPHPRLLTVAHTQLFFVAQTTNLWVTDGTHSGTRIVMTNMFFSQHMKPAGHRVFFEDSSRRLWVSDGTAAGSLMISDPQDGPFMQDPSIMLALGDRMVFAATDGVHGEEIWVSDGTPAGTYMLKDIYEGPVGSSPFDFVIYGDHLYFAATHAIHGREIWRTDGTTNGTELAFIVAPHVGATPSGHAYPTRHANPTQLTVFNDLLFFAADDGIGLTGRELWVSDGTQEGTRMLRNIHAGRFHTIMSLSFIPNSSTPRDCIPCGDLLYFTAEDEYGRHLWATDGTETGTRRVAVMTYPTPPPLTPSGDNVYFQGATVTHGNELWTWDGDHVRLVADIHPGTWSSRPRALHDLDGTLIFAASDRLRPFQTNSLDALYRSHGDTGTTERLHLLDTFHSEAFFPLGTSVFFRASHTNGLELWVSDGTESGSRMVRNIQAGTGSSAPMDFAALDGILYFTAIQDGSGRELWRSDGTHDGTWLAADILPGGTSSSPMWLTNHQGQIYFSAFTSTAGRELWRYDPGSGTASLVRNINPGSASSDPVRFVSANTTLYFSAQTSASGRELWRTDGTLDGTTLVRDIVSGFGSGDPLHLTFLNNTLFFTSNGLDSREMWRTDGTESGTYQIRNIRSRASNIQGGFSRPSDPRDFVIMNGMLFFTAFNDATGRELWRSDGTELGTVLLKDINPGLASSAVGDLTPLGNRLFFTAYSPEFGRELWETDGTTEGTRMVEDLMPGPTSSDPQSLTVRDGALYYFARDGGDDLSLRRYVPEGPTAFEVWMDTVSPQLTGDDRLPLADPYGTGFSNILLHDLDSPPGQSLGAGVFTGRAGIIGPGTLWNTDRMELRYLRRSNFWTRGLRFYVEASSNLTVPNWSQWSINPTQTVVDLGNGYEEVIIQFDADRTRLREFYRLVLEPHIQIPATTPGYHQ